MRSTPLFLTAAAALALSACAETAEDTTEAEPTATTAMAEETVAPADATAPTPTDPQGFVDMAASSDMYEIEAGKLAQANGKSQEVKDFGAMMERDHTKSSAELKTAAGQAEGVTVAPKLMPKHEANLAALRGAGENFDTLYKQQQVAAHEEALALLRAQADSGAAPSLKAFAAKTAPVVEGHLGHARELK